MSREKAIRTLFVMWLIIAGVPTLIMTIQSLSGAYGEDSDLAWQWLLTQTSPVISILLAAVFSEPSKRWKTAPTNGWRFQWAVGISLLQALAIFAVLLMAPALEVSPFTLFAKTQTGLSLFQAIAVASVGAVIFDGR